MLSPRTKVPERIGFNGLQYVFALANIPGEQKTDLDLIKELATHQNAPVILKKMFEKFFPLK